MTDPGGDAPAGGLDILGVGVGRVHVRDASSLRRAGDVLRVGNGRQAVRDGEALLIRTVLGSAPDAILDGHAGVHVGTDVDGVRSNDAPSGVEAPSGPFAGLQEVFSFGVAAGEEPDILFSDLARGWYKGKQAYAASQPAPEVVDILVRPEHFGESFRVATFTDTTAGGGYDVAGLGGILATIPLDGRVDAAPACLEASVASEPFVVERLIENGQTFRDLETPRSWTGTARFALTDEERAALEALIATGDVDLDGAIDLPGEAVLVEEGLNVRQTPSLSAGHPGRRSGPSPRARARAARLHRHPRHRGRAHRGRDRRRLPDARGRRARGRRAAVPRRAPERPRPRLRGRALRARRRPGERVIGEGRAPRL